MGFDISERTVSRWVKRAPRNPEHTQRWQTFLQNHREAIAAMDFFAVPTITFGLLYGFFLIGHDRRRIVHFGVTQHPTSGWVAQQLREALPYEHGYQHLIFDHDAKFGFEVEAAIEAVGLKAVRTSIRSPWQNGVAERWIGNCRRDLLDHMIPFNERHLKRLLSEYVHYTIKTEPTWGWRRTRRQEEARQQPQRDGGLFPRPGLAACIIATIWLLEVFITEAILTEDGESLWAKPRHFPQTRANLIVHVPVRSKKNVLTLNATRLDCTKFHALLDFDEEHVSF